MNIKKLLFSILSKNIIMCFYILFLTSTYGQAIGIGTANALGVFHIDASRDNPNSGKPTAAQQANDFIITKDGNVGIGTAFPTHKLHIIGNSNIDPLKIENLQRGDNAQNQMLVIDKDNVIKKVPSPRTFSKPGFAFFNLVFSKKEFLKDKKAGQFEIVDMAMLYNSIIGLEYNVKESIISFPVGHYQIDFSYGALRKTCELSSYLMEFPSDNGTTVRITNTSGNTFNNPNTVGEHSGTFIHTFKVAAPIKWPIKLGRGASGDCSELFTELRSNITQLIVTKF